jgi:PAS domain S-box-containing protein
MAIQEKYQALFENSITAMFINRPDGTILEANRAACRMFGYSEQEFRKLGRQGVIDPNSPGFLEKLKERDETGSTSGELIGVRKTGQKFWCEFSSSVYDDPAGGKMASMVLIDIFDNKEIQEGLKGVMNNVPGVLYRYVSEDDGSGKMQYVSGGVKQVLGFNPDEIFEDASLGWKNIHEDDVEYVVRSMKESAENNTKWVSEYRYHHPDGSIRWLRGMGNPISNKNGRVVWDSIVIDITEEKQAELNFKLMESVVTEANDAVLITKAEPTEAPDGPEIIYVNRSFEKMSGYKAEEVIGKTPRILQGPNTGPGQLQKMRDAIQNRENVEVDLLNYSKNGDEYWNNISLSPIFQGETCTHFISIQRDITLRKLRELQRSLSSEISLIFNREEGVKEALQSSLAAIAKLQYFDAVEFWLADRDRTLMNLVAHTIGNTDIADFYSTGNTFKTVKKGEGLPGITWKKKECLFWRNLDSRKTFIRQEKAAETGLKTAFSFPVMVSDKVLGVMILLLSEDLKKERYYVDLFKELSDQLASEIKRKELEEELFRIFNSAPDVICIAGLDGYYKKVNPAMSDLLEYSEEELLNTPIIDFIHPADKQKTEDEFEALNRGERRDYFENRHLSKSGKIIWLSWTTNLFHDEGITYSVARDITEEKKLRELFDQATRLAKIGSWEVDLINNKVYWSDITRQIHEEEPGFEPDLDSGFNYYKEGEPRELIQQAVEETMKQGTPWDMELPITTAKGNECWVRTIGEAEIVNGKPVRIYGSFQDINEKKEFQQLLDKANRLANIGGWEVDLENNSVYWSDITKSIYGVPDDFEPSIEKGLDFYKEGEDREKMWSVVQEAIDHGTPWDIEVRIATANGDEKWVRSIGKAERMIDSKYTRLFGSFQDIHMRKVTELAYKEALEEKNRILESIDDAFFAVDHDWTVTYWNNVAESVLGMSRDEIMGKNLWKLYEDATSLDFYTQYHKAVREQVNIQFEEYYPALQKWFDVSAYPSGSGLSVYFRDITERKENQEKILLKTRQLDAISHFNTLLIKEDDWRQALDKSLELFGEVTGADRVYYFKHSILDETGQDAVSMKTEWISGETTPEIDNPENQNLPIEDIRSFIDRVMNEGGYNEIVSEIEDREFAGFLERQNIKSILALPVFTGNEFRGFIGFDDCNHERMWSEEEITFLKTIAINLGLAIDNEDAEEALQKAFEEKNEVLESIGDGFFTIEKDFTVTYWNNMAEQLLFTPKGKVIGENLWDVFDKDLATNSFRQYSKAMKNQEALTFEDYYEPIGRWFDVNVYPSTSGISVFFKDITERKRADDRLKKLNSTLEEQTRALAVSNAELEQFAFVASHDLQEPLRMITGFLAQLEKKYDHVLDEKGRKYIHFATDGASRMRQIILDLLDYSRVGRIDTERENVDLNELIEDALSLNRKLISESNAKIEVEDMPVIKAAKAPMRQLFQNLVNNALKYHKRGSAPVVNISWSEDENFWHFEVRDNGIGISSQYLQKIFNIFQRLHGKEEYSGSGMGLAICKKIVEEHGGTIGVKSEEGKGSTFYFSVKKNQRGD